jgi:RNA polymerase sigma-70 factor (ECF subfamily)
MTPAEQQTALNCALGGDREALGRLLESLRPYFRVLLRGLQKGQAAGRVEDSDLVQDILLQALRQFGTFRGRTMAELTAWLRPIALRTGGHKVRDQHRGKRDVGREDSAVDLAGLRDSAGETPSRQAIRNEEAAQIVWAMARLPEDMRRVLLGRHVEGLSYTTLARELGRSEPAVRVLFTRALRRLRDECEGR